MPRYEFAIEAVLPDHPDVDPSDRDLADGLLSTLASLLGMHLNERGLRGISYGTSNRHLVFSAACVEREAIDIVRHCTASVYVLEHRHPNGCRLVYFVGLHHPALHPAQARMYAFIRSDEIFEPGGNRSDEEANTFVLDMLPFQPSQLTAREEAEGGTVAILADMSRDAAGAALAQHALGLEIAVRMVGSGEIGFRHSEYGGREDENRIASIHRFDALLGIKKVEDPLTAGSQRPSFLHLLGKSAAGDGPAALPRFDLVPSAFIAKARRCPPENNEATASSFAQWVYSLYSTQRGSVEDRKMGRDMEAVIFDQRAEAAGAIDDVFLCGIGSDWRLEHCGLSGRDGADRTFHEIHALQVNGRPLRACPDLVYRNARTNAALIVEIKYSRLALTSNLWPNVWAQLWCYSQIPRWSDAGQLTVVAEVWGERWEKGSRRGSIPSIPVACLRSSVRRDPRAPAYDRFFSALFEIYRGST